MFYYFQAQQEVASLTTTGHNVLQSVNPLGTHTSFMPNSCLLHLLINQFTIFNRTSVMNTLKNNYNTDENHQ